MMNKKGNLQLLIIPIIALLFIVSQKPIDIPQPFTRLTDVPHSYSSGDVNKLVRVNKDFNGLEFVSSQDINSSGSFPSGSFIKTDGTSTTTASIPFAQGLSIPNNKYLNFGDANNAQLLYNSIDDIFSWCMSAQCLSFDPSLGLFTFDGTVTPQDDVSGSLGRFDRKWNELWVSVWRTENTSAIQDGTNDNVYMQFRNTTNQTEFLSGALFADANLFFRDSDLNISSPVDGILRFSADKNLFFKSPDSNFSGTVKATAFCYSDNNCLSQTVSGSSTDTNWQTSWTTFDANNKAYYGQLKANNNWDANQVFGIIGTGANVVFNSRVAASTPRTSSFNGVTGDWNFFQRGGNSGESPRLRFKTTNTAGGIDINGSVYVSRGPVGTNQSLHLDSSKDITLQAGSDGTGNVVLNGNLTFFDNVQVKFGGSLGNSDFYTSSAGGVWTFTTTGLLFTGYTGWVFDGATDLASWRFKSSGDANLLFLNATTNKVGIGFDLPTAKLDVNGDINARSTIRTGANFNVKGFNGIDKNEHYIECATIACVATVECDKNYRGGILTNSTC